MYRADRIRRRTEGTGVQIKRAHDDRVALRDYARAIRDCAHEHLAARLAVKFAEQQLCKWLRLRDAVHIHASRRQQTGFGRRQPRLR